MTAVLLALSGTGLAVSFVGFIGFALGRLAYYRSCGLYAIANALCLLSDLLGHARVMAPVNAAVCVWSAYLWWKGGGGDDTKRRLRSLARTFTPTRRTAPQLGGA